MSKKETQDIVNKLIYHGISLIIAFVGKLIKRGSDVAIIRYKTSDGCDVMTIITKGPDI